MRNQDEKKKEFGSVGWLPLMLLPVVCCGGMLLIGGIGSLGMVAILSWISAPLVQLGAVGLLGAGLLALWRRRMRRNAAETQTIAEPAQVRTHSE
ncbi:MAG: hypothetical protein IIC13_15835 [SAR324 cluster bacterium]|nr:hypothetical protein [SAR324 cluster bacterium]MCH8888053.1 hypothetical protein [SAR324 cluster bacterium]